MRVRTHFLLSISSSSWSPVLAVDRCFVHVGKSLSYHPFYLRLSFDIPPRGGVRTTGQSSTSGAHSSTEDAKRSLESEQIQVGDKVAKCPKVTLFIYPLPSFTASVQFLEHSEPALSAHYPTGSAVSQQGMNCFAFKMSLRITRNWLSSLLFNLNR